jgi:hypothetical protein
MSATQIFVLPTAVLGVGLHGPFNGPAMGAAYPAYQFQITPGPGWPTTGGQVMNLTVELSRDGGTTWIAEASTDFGPTSAWRDPTTAALTVTLGRDQNGNSVACATTDRYRFTLNVLRATGSPVLTVSGLS